MRSRRKVCQRTVCQLCQQQCRYQGRGTRRTFFLLVKTRRTNWQSSCPSVVTEKSSTIVTGCTDKVVHRGVCIRRNYHCSDELPQKKDQTDHWKEGMIIRSNRPMEGRM